ncbi:MAG: hypothetical protein M1818_005970 [Claussenomyces sp. TS43310]|nr:MAG: hypothetical protein M1818_005970 [Claussenomyces sp. TS43310]
MARIVAAQGTMRETSARQQERARMARLEDACHPDQIEKAHHIGGPAYGRVAEAGEATISWLRRRVTRWMNRTRIAEDHAMLLSIDHDEQLRADTERAERVYALLSCLEDGDLKQELISENDQCRAALSKRKQGEKQRRARILGGIAS